MPSQAEENTPLLPAPTPGPARSIQRERDSKWRHAARYGLLILLGLAIGAGATLTWEKLRPHGNKHGPMVPPIYKLPPPTGLPRNKAYLMGPGKAGVASEEVTCSQMGVDILQQHNGTAVDAAITTTLCIGVLNAFSSGIGGGGFALVSVPGSKPMSIDFRETSPAASDPNMYTKLGRTASQVGALAVGVPGELRGLQAAHEIYGNVPWSELVMPVAKLARQFQVGRELARRLRIFGAFMLDDPTWKAVYAPQGTLLVEGDWMSRPTYAATLEKIAREGPAALYSGDIADDIVHTVKKGGGILTHADLEGYKANVAPAISGTFRGKTVYTTDAPAAGGVMLGLLNIMDPLLPARGDNVSCYTEGMTHNLLESMKFAFGARSEVCDPRFAKNLTRLAEFRTPEWADAQRAKITNVTHDAEYYGLDTEPIDDHGTTHLSVVDRWGGAASVTSTINLIWGSHVMCPKTGIILNDEQDDFAVPGQPDAFGLPPSPWNYPEPNKRPLSSTAPTIVHGSKGEVTAVLGGSGGSRIFPSVAQVLFNLECGDDLSEAIERPRLHNQIIPDITTLEVGPEGVDKKWISALEKRGHHIGLFDINVGAAEVQGILVDKRGVWASSDSRKNGVAAAY